MIIKRVVKLRLHKKKKIKSIFVNTNIECHRNQKGLIINAQCWLNRSPIIAASQLICSQYPTTPFAP